MHSSGILSKRFAAVSVFAAGVTWAVPIPAQGDQDLPELKAGNCAKTKQMQQAWNNANLRLILGAEASIFEYNDENEPKRDEDGDLIIHKKEYLVAANAKGEWYTFVGNADLAGTSTLFCVQIAGKNLQVPYNKDVPQMIPYESIIDQKTINKELDDPVKSYIFAQGTAQNSDIGYTLFLTNKSDTKGKNYILYSYKDGETYAKQGANSASVQEYGQKLAKTFQADPAR